MRPHGVMRPIPLPSPNQRLPSGAATIPAPEVVTRGASKCVTVPSGVIRLTTSVPVNQALPSGPAVIAPSRYWGFGMGTVNSTRLPAGVMRPMSAGASPDGRDSVNHTARLE
jgi:hypothetical protein